MISNENMIQDIQESPDIQETLNIQETLDFQDIQDIQDIQNLGIMEQNIFRSCFQVIQFYILQCIK